MYHQFSKSEAYICIAYMHSYSVYIRLSLKIEHCLQAGFGLISTYLQSTFALHVHNSVCMGHGK